MKIYKAIDFINIERPITIIKPLLDKYGNNVKNLYISDDCKLYDQDELDSVDYFGDCKEASIKVRIDENGRKSASVGVNGKSTPLHRALMISFDEGKHGTEFYETHQVDHINPSIPLDNTIYNLRWVTNEENMENAGKSGVMIKKYKKPLVDQICQMICDGCSRKEIRETLNVNGQLIDDIRAGRSHKSVSSQYIDQGFEYSEYDNSFQIERAHQVCKLIDEGYRTCDIVRKLDLPNQCVVSDIKFGRVYKYISSQYNFSKNL